MKRMTAITISPGAVTAAVPADRAVAERADDGARRRRPARAGTSRRVSAKSRRHFERSDRRASRAERELEREQRLPRAASGRGRSRRVDQAAVDVRVLVEVVARADPVVAVGDDQAAVPSAARPRTSRTGERQLAARTTFFRSRCDMGVVARAGAGAGSRAAGPSPCGRIISAPCGARRRSRQASRFREEQAQVVGRRREVVVVGLVLPMLLRHTTSVPVRG